MDREYNEKQQMDNNNFTGEKTDNGRPSIRFMKRIIEGIFFLIAIGVFYLDDQ